MSKIDQPWRGARRVHASAVGVLAALVIAGGGLTACGGSSKPTNAAATGSASTSTSTSTSTGSSATQPGSGAAGAFAGPRSGTMRECLQKNGITLPKPSPGTGGPQAGGGFLGRQLPKGVTRAQFQAALQKCAPGRGHFLRQGSAGVRAPAFRQALAKFAECLRQNGVNVPTPNTSGKGPIFSTKGVNTSSPQFKAATMKCRGALLGAFRATAHTRPGG